MKNTFITFLVVLFSVNSVSAQILRTEELEEYAKEWYGEKWVDAATDLGSRIEFDKNDGLTLSNIISAEGKSKEDLYVLLNYWFTATFNDANSVINLNDKELGTIIAQGLISNIAVHTGGLSKYGVSIRPVIKCDIKDGRVRVTYTVPNYEVSRLVGGGILGAFSDSPPSEIEEKWILPQCYPFVLKDSHKKASSKALIMTYAYSRVVMDKIEECIKNGLIGNEDDDW